MKDPPKDLPWYYPSANSSRSARSRGRDFAAKMPTDGSTPALLWLLIGIPTIPRPTGGADYLGRSLSTVLEALPASDADPLHGRVGCLVLNNRPGAHAEFARLRGEYEGLHDSHPPTRAFSFEERDAAEVYLGRYQMILDGRVMRALPYLRERGQFRGVFEDRIHVLSQRHFFHVDF